MAEEIIVRKIINAQVGLVIFDACLSDNHMHQAELTEHPVEDSASISDHIINKPIEIEINGIVSNTPIILANDKIPSPISTDTQEVADRVDAAYAELRKTMSDGILVDVITSLRNYPNMAIVSMGVQRDVQNGNVLNVNLSLKQVIIASSEQVDIPQPVRASNKQQTDKGKTVKTDANEKQTEKAGSVLSSMFDSGASFVGGS